MKKIGIIRPQASDLQTFRLEVFDPKSGNILTSEDISISHDQRSRIENKKITDFFLNLPVEMLGFRILDLPFSDKKKLAEVIPFELQGLIMDDINDIVFDSVCIDRDSDRFKVLVVYVEKRRLASILQSLSHLGIEPSVAGSMELKSILKETKDPAVITERLKDSISMQTNPSEAPKVFQVEDLRSPIINLRTGPFEFKGDTERLSRLMRILISLLIALAISINIDLSLRILRGKKDIYLMRKEMRWSYSELFPSEKRISDELYQLKAHLKEVKDRMDLVKGAPILDFLLTLSNIKPEGIVFHEIGVSTEGLNLKGEATSMEEINKLKAGLSAMELNVSELKPLAGGRLNFTISGRMKR